MYRPHECGRKLEEGLAGGQSVGQVEKALVCSVASCRVCSGDDVLLQHGVKCKFFIQ